MKIAQTLWSNNKDLLKYHFGWLSPMYHLASWALSCLRLKEYYNDLHLYTDTTGRDILISYMKLPYDHVHVIYDDMGDCNENFWAVPKIMTYSRQDCPFIHVDGDVFIWEPFGKDFEQAGLIAQNLEIGTDCYRGKMDQIAADMDFVPDILKTELSKESIPAYNAGIMGGCDFEFFRKYADVALDVAGNNFKDNKQNKASIDFNILFEQVLFHSLSEQENKKVTCYFKEPIADNGYTKAFCNFAAVPHGAKYLHLIGSHKRNLEICTLMCRTLFQSYPNYYFKLTALFGNMAKKFAQC